VWQHGQTQHSLTQHSLTQHSLTQHSLTQHGQTQHSLTQHSLVTVMLMKRQVTNWEAPLFLCGKSLTAGFPFKPALAANGSRFTLGGSLSEVTGVTRSRRFFRAQRARLHEYATKRRCPGTGRPIN
jgi:hypothetical protein